ncbi:uncharacterized protein [Mytilus edulis]|uniref:uncharacterized protein n=1 Tax=Mytilus edulis TaxID=6550 RepID=UPI0039EF0814
MENVSKRQQFNQRAENGLPAEIKALDKDSAKVFTHLLEEESYPHFESRVMLAGEQGTGKTTIARYLIGKGPTRVRKSTDGIGLYTGLSYIDRETEEWLEGKQDFSLEELTISRSLRQKPLDIPTSSLSTGLSTDLSKQCNESLVEGATVQFNEQHVDFREKNEKQDVAVERIQDNSRSRAQGNWDKLKQIIGDDRPITNVLLDLHNTKDDPNIEKPVAKVHLSPEKIPVQNVHFDLQKQQDHSLAKITVLHDFPLDSEKTKCISKGEKLAPYVPCDLHKQQGNQKNLVQNMPLDLIKQPYLDKKVGPKVDKDKPELLHLEEIPIPNIQFDSDTPLRKCRDEPFFVDEQNRDYHDYRPMPTIAFPKENQDQVLQDDVPQYIDPYKTRTMASNPIISSDQPNYSHEDTQCKEFEEVIENIPITVHKESKEYGQNQGQTLDLSETKHTSSPEDLSMHAAKGQIKTLAHLSEVDQTASSLSHSVESITNPGIITKLKRLFRVSKEVKEIKISITEAHILKQSLKVGKKMLHQRHIAPVIIWDFGGQDIFYSTHQSFLSYRAIYLIVLDGSRTLDDPCQFEQYLPGKSGPKTARDYLQFWINTIVTYCKGSHHGFPKIMIVFTHKDKLKTGEVETTREQLFLEIKSMFQGSTLMSHLVIEDKIFVNARNKNDPEMAKIRRGIIWESKRQPTWGQNFPKCFIPLELEFENLIRENRNVITFDDLKKINTLHPIRPLSDAELKVFLKFQHAIGEILYFDEPGLDTHITLLPTYLIDAFKSIITDKRFCKGEKQKEHLWNLMSQKGVIFKSAIEKLWRTGKYQRFDQHKEYLVAVMTHLDILVEPKRYDLKRNRIPTDFYFVASMVQAEDTTGYLQSPFLTDRNIAISFSSSSAIIPPALSFRFITYCLSIFDVKKYGDRKGDMLFHRSAVFTIDPSLEIHILCEDDRIFVRLVHAKNKVLILKDLASSICDCLKSALENISQLYIKTSSDNSEIRVGNFEMNFCCSVAKDSCLLSIGEFKKIDSIWVCPGHKLDHDKFVMSSWITEKEIMRKCELTCPVANEDFLSEDLSALHLRRLSILYTVDEIRQLVGYLYLSYTEWEDLFTSETEPQLLKFKALCLCHEQSTLTFRKIKKAVEEGKIQNPHTLCKVMRGAFVDFDTDPEKWDLVPSDEDIDKMAPLIGKKSLFFLVELGMDLETWDTINHRQTKRDLVKLNKDILDEWMLICNVKNVRPAMRMIAQAYKSIGKDIRVLENTLFN